LAVWHGDRIEPGRGVTQFYLEPCTTITDEQGRDRTKEVPIYEQVVRVGGPGPPKKEERPPKKGGHI
jgi:hypothetical protein